MEAPRDNPNGLARVISMSDFVARRNEHDYIDPETLTDEDVAHSVLGFWARPAISRKRILDYARKGGADQQTPDAWQQRLESILETTEARFDKNDTVRHYFAYCLEMVGDDEVRREVIDRVAHLYAITQDTPRPPDVRVKVATVLQKVLHARDDDGPTPA